MRSRKVETMIEEKPRNSRAGRIAPGTGSTGALLVLVALAAGCIAGVQGGGISGTGSSQGPVTDFGSIYVTGIEWFLDDADVFLDGQPAPESALGLGMVVTVVGDIAADGRTGRASRVDFDDSVEGPIVATPVSLPSGAERSLRVLDDDVIVHVSETVFAGGATFAGLAQDDVIEVSGLRDAEGVVRATRVEGRGTFVPGVSRVEVHGVVQALQKNIDGSGIFDLGTLTVRYTASTDFDDVNRGSLAEGMFVEVEGTIGQTGELDASEIERESDDFVADDRDDALLDGFVSGFSSLLQPFVVSGHTVDATSATLVPTGLQLQNGLRVAIEGSLQGGVLRADRVRVQQDSGDFTCDEDFTAVSAGWRLDNVKVPGGAFCGLLDVEVEGNVQAEEGGSSLLLHESIVDGDVQAKQAAFVSVVGNRVGGNIQVVETRPGENNAVDGNDVTGSIQVEKNEASFSIDDNDVGGNIQVVENVDGVTVRFNYADGDIQCKENSPDPITAGNTAGGDRECDD